MNQLKNLLEILHAHATSNTLEIEDAFVTGLALGQIIDDD